MIPLTDPSNLIMLFLQCIIIGIPLTILAFGMYYGLRKIPSLEARCLIPLIAGALAGAWYTSIDPSNPGKFGLLMFIIGAFIHPLLVLPPITVAQNSLHRIPVPYAVFISIFLSLACVMAWGLAQGDMKSVDHEGFVWQILNMIIRDLLIASVISGLIISVDKYYPKSGFPSQ